jgi:nucleoside-diphosphate-sugar epimerase
MKRVVVLGAGGFIGNNLVTRLVGEGCHVTGVDLKYPEFSESLANDFIIGDLRIKKIVDCVFTQTPDEVYQLAADMGGAGYVFTGEHDADIMHNSALININVAEVLSRKRDVKMFFSSSACAYPGHNQRDALNPKCSEDSMYPADPDSEYGWEKIFAERLYLSYHRNYKLDVRIARFHNIFGPLGAWNNGKEKAPAALCRKVVEAKNTGEIEIWGDGEQTRSFLYIDECLEGVLRLMNAPADTPIVNIGSEEMVTINALANMIIAVSGKTLTLKHVDGPLGVRGRNSDNKLIYDTLGWKPSQLLLIGLEKTYEWIESQLKDA